MKFIEKVSGWMIAIGLAIAVLLAFNYLDVFMMTCYKTAGFDTKIYRGLISSTSALVNILAFGFFFIICKKLKRPVLQVKKISTVDIVLIVILAAGMLGFVETFIIVSDKIGAYIKSLSEQMTEYRKSVDRYTGIEQQVVPFWDSILYLISICFIVPFEEELIFRGAIFGVLKRKMKPVFAIILTALLFGVMHRVSVHTAYALICGMILTAVYHYTENIFASVIIHSFFNLVGSGLGDFLKLEQLGIPSDVRLEILTWANIICIMMMVPAAAAFIALGYNSKKRRKAQAESVKAGE